jgi:hypothetical protein
MPHMLVGICAALVAACFAFTAFAADVHLSQTGSDAADGSRETPVEILVADGRYERSQPAAIAIDTDHPRAKIIPDVFHMHITHSGFTGLKHLRGDFFAIFQFNDAPAAPAIDQLKDEHRVFPGDGILPLADILRDLLATGYADCISLELYNPEYWKRDLEGVAREGREKTLKVIAQATTGKR